MAKNSNNYIGAIGSSTPQIENDDWKNYNQSYTRTIKNPNKNVASQNKSPYTYMDAAPVVITRNQRQMNVYNNPQQMMTARQNSIMEQQIAYNKKISKLWEKKVSQMEEEELPEVKLNETPVQEEKLDVINGDAAVVAPVEDAEKQPENIFGYPHQDNTAGLYGAGMEMSDEEFLANVEANENENEEESLYGCPESTDEDPVDEISVDDVKFDDADSDDVAVGVVVNDADAEDENEKFSVNKDGFDEETGEYVINVAGPVTIKCGTDEVAEEEVTDEKESVKKTTKKTTEKKATAKKTNSAAKKTGTKKTTKKTNSKK